MTVRYVCDACGDTAMAWAYDRSPNIRNKPLGWLFVPRRTDGKAVLPVLDACSETCRDVLKNEGILL